ncbi:hypothetical protein QQS21_011052 [Conoideocrella luteorostrata]|uniref:Uncharacterized protein n=1 Tax=Conoideocrella luteorostrata TaxID=1105319 RepID=A0AAJ0CE27_9HYPO|nr:hypothetical protein QQS21_011052 [Conoideocrella luteorostrata]
MASSHDKLSDVPVVGRLRDLFRKKRGVDPDGHDIRELLRRDRGDLLKEFERIVASQRASESLSSSNELHLAVSYSYVSASTQTDVSEEPATPVEPGLDDTTREATNCTSSSTQTDVPKEPGTPVGPERDGAMSEATNCTSSSTQTDVEPATPVGPEGDGAMLEATNCTSSSTQTDVPKDPGTPVGLGLDGATRETTNYTSASTQVDPIIVEENISGIITQPTAPDAPSRSASPASDVSGTTKNETFRFGNVAEGTKTPRSTLLAVPIRKTRSIQSLSAQSISSSPPRPKAPVAVRSHRYIFDDGVNEFLLQKTSRLPFNGRNVVVRLPPERLSIAERVEIQLPPQRILPARGIVEKRRRLQALLGERSEATADEGDVEDNEEDVKSSAASKPFNPASWYGAQFRF